MHEPPRKQCRRLKGESNIEAALRHTIFVCREPYSEGRRDRIFAPSLPGEASGWSAAKPFQMLAVCRWPALAAASKKALFDLWLKD
jgi:hypothetical protein